MVPMFDPTNLWHWVILVILFPILWFCIVASAKILWNIGLVVVLTPIVLGAKLIDWVQVRREYPDKEARRQFYQQRQNRDRALNALKAYAARFSR